MELIRSFLGRRQFIFALIGSTMTLAFGRAVKAFDFMFREGIARASEKEGSAEKRVLKGCVVYYSATGATGQIAGAIYRGMNTVMECDVAPVKKIDPKDMGKYDVVAIGAPIWYSRETANVRIFINNMPHMSGKHCILFCTHGSGPNGIFYSLMQTIRKKAFTIIGWNDWYGDATHVLHQPQPYVTHGHPDEIDLVEAEAFGREMAERSTRIHAGETDLIPEIPIGNDVDSLWTSRGLEPRTGGGGSMDSATQTPTIDTSRCIYPRCTACADNCPVGAIDLSITSPAKGVSESPIFVKGCLHCGYPLCQRACAYDAIIYENRNTRHEFDMTKCTYPKCTLCIDNCLMQSIDFSHNPPVIHNNCEGCDVCWCVCPTNAISVSNLAETHERLAPSGKDSGFFNDLNRAEIEGRFRRLVPVDEVGWGHPVYKNPNAPRIVLLEKNYPYHIDEG